ncbi:MAG: DNA polymerase III subunit beta [Oscillospiraceae bacterium]|nr:DNA polymerase III subunit beta [Oscillospiraceae bacterium]
MRFECEKQSLYEALSNVSRAVGQKTSIEALEGIKIKVSENILEFTGYDLNLGIKKEIEAVTNGCGEFVVSSGIFNEIVRKMPESMVYVDIDDNLNVNIKSGVTEYNISAISAQEYPDIPVIDRADFIKLPQHVLKNMIKQTIFAVSTDTKKPILTGELFDIADSLFNMVAIDNYKLALRTEGINADKDYKFVVPSKALSEVEKLLDEASKEDCVIYVGKKHIIFEINGYSVISRLLEGEFYNYKVSIPKNFSTEVVIKVKSLIDMLDRCGLIISEKHKAPVRCKFSNGSLSLNCKTSVGKFSDEMEIDLSGNCFEIGFNNRYLLEALRACESDKVKLQMNGPLSPIKIVPADGDSFTFLVLPVQLSSN